MHPFKSFTLKWWQGSLFKLAMIAGGISMAMTWPGFFSKLTIGAWVVSICLSLYVSWVWWKQIRA